ncbi:MAG: TetR/AcrR family transcriptional regulator [Acidimicrobiales bacterium]
MVLTDDRPPHGERREHLLAVAKRVFAVRGFQATTMDDIAKEAGFTKPILYQYFESKPDLYREIVTSTAQKMVWKLAHIVAKAETPREKIEVAFAVYFEMVVDDPDAFRVLFIHSHDGENAGELRKVELMLVSFVEPFIDVSISDEHRNQLAGGIVGMAEGAAVRWLVQQNALGWPTPPNNEAQRLASRIATLAWGGLRAIQLED